jgi:hypothetical protein
MAEVEKKEASDKKIEKKTPLKKKVRKKGSILTKLLTFFLLILLACGGAIYYAYDKKIITIDKDVKTLKATPIGEFIPTQSRIISEYTSPILEPIQTKDIKFEMSMLNETYINEILKKMLPPTIRIKKKKVAKKVLLAQASYLFIHERKYERTKKAIWAIKQAGGKITSCVVAKKTFVFIGPFYGVTKLQEFYSKFDVRYKSSIGKRITRDTYLTLCEHDGKNLIIIK